jgi:hypothetical protein
VALREPVSCLKRALTFTLVLLVMPLIAQDGPELTEALVDQRITALREGGAADSDQTLRTYQDAKSWLTSTVLHRSGAAKYIEELYRS